MFPGAWSRPSLQASRSSSSSSSSATRRKPTMRQPLSLLLAVTYGCATGAARPARQAGPGPPPTAPAQQATGDSTSPDRQQYPSTYQPHLNPPVLLRNSTGMPAAGQEISNRTIFLRASPNAP